MALSSNSNAGSTETKIGAGALSNFNTENKSNGNFSGGDINFDTNKLSINNPFDTKESQQPTFNTEDVFKPTVSGNLDIDLPKTNNNNSGSNNTTYSNNSKEPTMTVDEVYGKSSNNQPVVEKQGDYTASSNEKSNVETSTFGKQDEISVTPTSVTESKGMVGNAAIQSVEGLDFQQKDKASVDVLDSKKKRDKAEAEDSADSMRNKLKANGNNVKQKEGGEDFRIGDRDEDVANAKAEVDRLANEKTKYEKEQKSNAGRLKSYETEIALMERTIEQEDADYQAKKANAAQLDAIGQKMQEFDRRYQEIASRKNNIFTAMGIQGDLDILATEVIRFCKQVGVEPPAQSKHEPNAGVASETFQTWEENFRQEHFDGLKDFSSNSIAAYKAEVDQEHLLNLQQFTGDLDRLKDGAKLLEERQKKLQGLIADNAKKSTAAQKAYDDLVNNTYVGEEEATTPISNAETSYNDAMDAIKNSADATPEQKAQAEEAITNLEDSRKALEEAAAKARSGNPADMVAYQEALKTYNKNLKEAQKIGNRFTQTDFNEKYTKAVARANDFKVTLADGTEMEYSDFATEEATKSPQYAKAMYEAKAQQYETGDENGNGKHPILAKIERWKAKMSQTWLGSKLTWADDQVRNQFNQMAKTDMRATYAAYNNVLNDTTGKYSDEDKAEASTAINQAKALMTASVALQASTGSLSSIGDSVDDGTFGITNPKDLNAWQKTLNTVDNIIRITLGLGISPAANKAYQNMYYMAGDKVNNSLLFNKDFDGDGFALCQEYGNSAATGMIAGFCELGVGVAMLFNPASIADGINLIADAVSTFNNGLYGVRNEVETSQKYTQEVLEYFKEAEDIAESSGNEEAVQEITNAITQIENFELKADEVGDLDNWLEGSGSNTASNEKFNQSLTYDEWLKLIEADPTMREYAKSIAKKKDKDAQKNNADTGVNS